MQQLHLLSQRDNNDLLGQSHGADDNGEQDGPAVEPLLTQGIAGQSSSNTGQEHGHGRDEHNIKQPQKSRVLKQAGIVVHSGVLGKPDGYAGIDLDDILE